MRPESLPSGCSSKFAFNHILVDGGQTYATLLDLGSPDYLGKYLLVSSQATNDAGSRTIWSLGSSKIVGPPAINSSASISGSSTVGSVMTAAIGTWISEGTTTYAIQWFRCASEIPYETNSGDQYSCSAISGATSSTYTSTSTDEGKYLTARITATNSVGASLPLFNRSKGVTGAPGFVSGPLISGTTTKGSTLTSSGTYKGFPVPTLTQAWYRCTSAVNAIATSQPSGCTAISGATSSTYTSANADVSSYISVLQTLTSTSGVISSWSATTAQITGPPVNSSPPTISGTAMAGQVVTAEVGTWNATPTATYSYGWYVCTTYLPNGQADTVPVNCSAIAGATSATYTIDRIYYGKGLSVRVTATNSGGSASFMSVSSLAIDSLPFTTTTPAISGGATTGSFLTAFYGTWLGHNSPSTTHKWYRCTSVVSAASDSLPAGCTATGTRTGQTYIVGTDDVGKYISAEVVGTNNKGSTSKWTPSTAAITQAPGLESDPFVSGTATSGQTLSLSANTWSGTPTPTISYQWMSCTQSSGSISSTKPASCSEISGATSTSYTLTSGEVGKYILIQITATNSAGTVIRLTASTAIVN